MSMVQRNTSRNDAQQDAPVMQAAMADRIAIEQIEPGVEQGRFAAKAIVGQPVNVTAVIFADGHDVLAARVRWRCTQASAQHSATATDEWHSETLTLVKPLGNDLWEGVFTPTETGTHEFVVEAWWDLYGTYHYELSKKHAAGVPIALELQEGQAHVSRALERVDTGNEQARALESLKARLETAGGESDQVALLLSRDTLTLMQACDPQRHLSQSATMPLEVDRALAEFASWYELFPRSESPTPGRHGTFNDVHARLPTIRDMGFDVLYFPPIHPIGHTHRKGPNNTLTPGPGDPGSPYAIGNEHGGHDAVHPELGTLEDFRALVAAAHEHELEIALDFAIQCSPDHPWLAEHPGWFAWRPDGTIRYAENPPKKYEDIVNVDFYAEDAIPGLWLALRDVVQGWVNEGVKIFRVDNPHTKPFPFWEWLIADIRSHDPDVIFFAEAFTRPAIMARLGKVGFTMSYTYFTWRNTKAELTEYLTQLNESPLRECYRPNFFVNTPDINPTFLQGSGRPGFLIRAALATMGSGLWGMYSGFELCEAAPVPGKEEYLDSEKYQLKTRDYFAPGNISAEIARLNWIRRRNPALQTHLGIRFGTIDNDRILYFIKSTPDMSNVVLVAISLDPFHDQSGHFELPLWELGLEDHADTHGEDLMTGHRWTWHGKWQSTHLTPQMPFGIWRLRLVQ
ncbi:alpha-1,4-glucan--maltose-1-phosphate maltosyltransferase [Kushneria konosiri]|uniref:Alpha-1,4-glucan:maltose-1-phosphate maltosyltransferase n=1 Tax=Kushneria konosiri TaxID=698828 RepID=A0A2Z2H3M6_9GAMM|nr:alpha-1,4-glucan--maltose-1-phosphate maltosyltransferase [Kushneria konosiri]ARS51819.1 alpha-1,4-glucan--maltose-1-phosphate maltosyltransferase [Kushneria konosiri]